VAALIDGMEASKERQPAAGAGAGGAGAAVGGVPPGSIDLHEAFSMPLAFRTIYQILGIPEEVRGRASIAQGRGGGGRGPADAEAAIRRGRRAGPLGACRSRAAGPAVCCPSKRAPPLAARFQPSFLSPFAPAAARGGRAAGRLPAERQRRPAHLGLLDGARRGGRAAGAHRGRAGGGPALRRWGPGTARARGRGRAPSVPAPPLLSSHTHARIRTQQQQQQRSTHVCMQTQPPSPPHSPWWTTWGAWSTAACQTPAAPTPSAPPCAGRSRRGG
jgi:hypothetical protein